MAIEMGPVATRLQAIIRESEQEIARLERMLTWSHWRLRANQLSRREVRRNLQAQREWASGLRSAFNIALDVEGYTLKGERS
jgi:hypothetical protein